jgi:peptidoglycan/LPS O-acetylase OafA/YrhL
LSSRLLAASLKHPRLWFSLQFAAMATVGVLSLLPAPDMGGSDKLLHFIAYAAMSGGFALLLSGWTRRLSAALAVAVYGVLLEYLQGMTGYRLFDPADMLANAAGAAAGLALGFQPLRAGFLVLDRRF